METNYYKPLKKKTIRGYMIECRMEDKMYGNVIGRLEVKDEEELMNMTGRTFNDIDWPSILCYGDIYDRNENLILSGHDFRTCKELWSCNRKVNMDEDPALDKEIFDLLKDAGLLKKENENENNEIESKVQHRRRRPKNLF